jgi:hypothetical protein
MSDDPAGGDDDAKRRHRDTEPAEGGALVLQHLKALRVKVVG